MPATRYLLVDDTPIAAQRGLTRTVHAARKYDGNPIMVAEAPWEGPLVPSTEEPLGHTTIPWPPPRCSRRLPSHCCSCGHVRAPGWMSQKQGTA